MDIKRQCSDLRLAYTVAYSAAQSTSGVLLLLTQASDKIKWDKVAYYANHVCSDIEDATSFMLPNVSYITDKINDPLPRRWSVRFSSSLEALSFHLGDFSELPEKAIQDAKIMTSADSNWPLNLAEKISDLRSQIEPFYFELKTMIRNYEHQITCQEVKPLVTESTTRSAQYELKPNPVLKPDGWVKADLVSQAKRAIGSFSPSTFDRIRASSGVPAGVPGGRGQQHRYSCGDVERLIDAVRKREFRNSKEIAQSWRDLIHH